MDPNLQALGLVFQWLSQTHSRFWNLAVAGDCKTEVNRSKRKILSLLDLFGGIVFLVLAMGMRRRVNDSVIQARGATLVLLVLLAWISSSCAQVAVSHDTPSASAELRGILTASSGQRFEYSLTLPENWKGKYTLEAHPNYFKVNYLYSNPNNEAMNNPYLFGISVFTQAEWETEQKGPHGHELLARDGVVFVESIGLDNPLSGSAAEELQRMAGQVPDIVRRLSVTSVAPASAIFVPSITELVLPPPSPPLAPTVATLSSADRLAVYRPWHIITLT